MSVFDVFRYRLRVLLRPGQHARELDEEIRFHLALEAMQREHGSRGTLSTSDARWAARRRFGNLTSTKEQAREMAGLGFLDTTEQDVKFALRSFRRAPGFTLVAMLTLAVGIGANTAIFSAVNAILLRPLPFAEPNRLVQVAEKNDALRMSTFGVSALNYLSWTEGQRGFSGLGAMRFGTYTLTGRGDPETYPGNAITASLIPLLGLRPAPGR